jgi:hypothetical protein
MFLIIAWRPDFGAPTVISTAEMGLIDRDSAKDRKNWAPLNYCFAQSTLCQNRSKRIGGEVRTGLGSRRAPDASEALNERRPPMQASNSVTALTRIRAASALRPHAMRSPSSRTMLCSNP